jgi:hypothetical protein
MKDSEATPTSLCARAEDLVAYLYHEASGSEAQDFERHTARCASCTAELAAFGQVRNGISEWRSHSLGLVAAVALANEVEPERELSQSTAARKPSALAALREFFALSPVWLRAATAVAGLAICALVVWAGARIGEAPRVVFVERSVPVGPSQADIDAMVAKRVREELAARTDREEISSNTVVSPVSAQSSPPPSQSVAVRPNSAQRRGRVRGGSSKPTPAQGSTDDYEQLARDLQLVPTRDEEDLPRLIDLIDEAN